MVVYLFAQTMQDLLGNIIFAIPFCNRKFTLQLLSHYHYFLKEQEEVNCKVLMISISD